MKKKKRKRKQEKSKEIALEKKKKNSLPIYLIPDSERKTVSCDFLSDSLIY